MSEIGLANRKQIIWNRLAADFHRFSPNSIGKAACPLCGRQRTVDQFSIEHIIPQNVVSLDPKEVRDPGSETHVPKDTRSQTTLLCSHPLIINRRLYKGGCNGLKGTLYDREVARMLDGKPRENVSGTQHNALKMMGYLAMFAEFGYAYGLSRAGVDFRRDLLLNRDSKVQEPHILTGTVMTTAAAAKDFAPDHKVWTAPFSFKFTDTGHYCIVGVRSYCVMMPITHDPRLIGIDIPILPTRMVFHPDFTQFGY